MELQIHFACLDSGHLCSPLELMPIPQQEVLTKVSWTNSEKQYYFGCSARVIAGVAEVDWKTLGQTLMALDLELETACSVMLFKLSYTT